MPKHSSTSRSRPRRTTPASDDGLGERGARAAFARERLPQVIDEARLAELQTAVFAVPDLFAPGYRATPAAPTSAVPVPREAADLTVATAR